MRTARSWVQWGLALALGGTIGVTSACSDDDDGGGGGIGNATGSGASSGKAGSSGASGTSSNAGSANGGGNASGATGSGGGKGGYAEACSGLPVGDGASGAGGQAGGGNVCAGVTFEAERIDVDMYIMMDRSVSMAEKVGTDGRIRWNYVRDAVEQFVQDPGAASIRMGIQFFGQSGTRDDSLDCDVSRYATPAVEIGYPNEVGAQILQQIDDTLPGGLTPTLPALQGAVQHAKSWAGMNPGRTSIVVLVTDGFPTQCQSPVSVSDIADVAEAGYAAAPRVATYVVGLAASYNLDTIARAGGTRAAFLIDEENITASFVSTLLNIASGEIACEYEIPEATPGMQIDPSKVQVLYTPAVGAVEEVPKAQTSGDCSSSSAGGWYYDNNTNPTKIMVCPCTCARFAAGRVDVRLGCEPTPVEIE